MGIKYGSNLIFNSIKLNKERVNGLPNCEWQTIRDGGHNEIDFDIIRVH